MKVAHFAQLFCGNMVLSKSVDIKQGFSFYDFPKYSKTEEALRA
jgi:hypothetical protein